MTSFIDEFMPYLIFVTIILTASIINKLRQEIRELKEMLQQRLPSEVHAIESE